jgi:hypothetical protein
MIRWRDRRADGHGGVLLGGGQDHAGGGDPGQGDLLAGRAGRDGDQAAAGEADLAPHVQGGAVLAKALSVDPGLARTGQPSMFPSPWTPVVAPSPSTPTSPRAPGLAAREPAAGWACACRFLLVLSVRCGR